MNLWHPTALKRLSKFNKCQARKRTHCHERLCDIHLLLNDYGSVVAIHVKTTNWRIVTKESVTSNCFWPTKKFMKFQYIHVKLTNWVIVMKESVTSNCSWRTRTVQCMSSWQSDSSWRNVWHGMHFVSFISSWFGARRKLQKSCTAGNTRCSSLSAGNVTRYPGEILLVVSCEELPWMEPRMSSPSRCSLKLMWKFFLLVVTGYVLHTRAHRSPSFKKVWVCKDCTVDKSLNIWRLWLWLLKLHNTCKVWQRPRQVQAWRQEPWMLFLSIWFGPECN